MFKRFGKILAGVGSAVALGSSQAFAALDLTGATVNTTDVGAIMALVVPALLVLWGYRKVIKVTNRS